MAIPVQLYNEEVNDLLAQDNTKLQIHESKESGIYVAGLREEIVTSLEHVLQLLEEGDRLRHVGETKMNKTSSRSHSIFRMVRSCLFPVCRHSHVHPEHSALVHAHLDRQHLHSSQYLMMLMVYRWCLLGEAHLVRKARIGKQAQLRDVCPKLHSTR